MIRGIFLKNSCLWFWYSYCETSVKAKDMIHKTLFYLLMIGICTACGSKSPGMSKEEAAKELSEQTEHQEADPPTISTAVSTFADDYTPPAGIKYQPKIMHTGAMTLNIQAALKNIRPLKVSDIGKMKFHFTGVDAKLTDGIACGIAPIDNTYLLTAVQGLYLLDHDFKMIKQLFKNDAESKNVNGYLSFSLKKMIVYAYYDTALSQIRCNYLTQEHTGVNFVATIPFSDIITETEPWTPDSITSKLNMGRAFMNSTFFCGIKEGYVKSVPFSGRFYTHGVQGDTLCCFEPQAADDYTPTATYRGGEDADTYEYRNKTYIRLAYDNTVYSLENPSTLKAAYQLDFGTLHRPDGKKVVANASSNLDDDYFIDRWLETDRHLFIRITKGYDSPNSREAKTVSLYSLIYDKATGDFFSLPQEVGSQEPDFPVIAAGSGKDTSFFPRLVAGGIPITYVNGKWMKENKPELTEGRGVSDDELVLITIE